MGQVDARIAKANPRIGRGEQHLAARFVIFRVVNGAHQVAGDRANRLGRPDLADWVGPLIGGAHFGTFRGRTAVIGNRRK